MGAQHEHALIPLPENQFAQAAVDQLLSLQLDLSPPLVYLSGPAGVGKTHLVLQGIRQLLENYPPLRFRILPIYEFATLHMEVASSGNREAEASLKSLLDVDLLVCEDLQHLDRQIWLQKKLILLLDQLLQSGTKVLLVSQFPIGEFEQAIPKLVSRFHAGVTATMSQPDRDSRVHLLKHFALHHEVDLAEQLFQELAEQLPASPRELLGAVVQLEASQRHARLQMTSSKVRDLLDLDQTENSPSLSEITRQVAREFGVSVQKMRSAAREQSLLIPRQVAMLLSRELSQVNYADIGAYFGGRSHSTVIHACRTLQKKSDDSPELDYRLSQLRRTLKGIPIKPR